MSPRPYVLAETNWEAVRDERFELAVLPWGATEAHNYHLPYGTDNYQAEYVAAEAARIAWEGGTRLMVLPCIPFGIQSGQLDIPFCIHLNPTTQHAILKDLVDTLDRQGIPKLVILNGHGGNAFKNMVRELWVHNPRVYVCVVDWYKVGHWPDFFDHMGEHAGEMETAAMLHIRPDLVLPLDRAGDGKAKSWKIKGFREGWASAQRLWTLVTRDTGVGFPRMATPGKGQRYLEFVCNKIARFFQQLAAVQNLEDLYE